MKHSDGSIISQFFQTQDKPTSGGDIYDQGLRMVVGQVEKVYYVDDQDNMSKTYVEYDVSIRDEKGGQSILRNLRKVELLGGTNDSDEVVLEPNEFASSGKLDTSNFFKNKNGTTVLVAFIYGSKDRPVIIGALQHPKKTGAKRTDGIRKKGEFRGIQWEINKLGELTLTYLSNRGPDGKLKRANTGPTTIKIDQTGALSVSDNQGQLIKMDRAAQKIRIVTKANMEIVVGQDESKTVAGNSTTTIQGNESVTDTGNYDHTAANQTFTSAGNIKIGSAGADQNLVRGPDFLNLYNAHTHIGNLGVPTGVPIIPMTAAQLAARNFTE